MKVNRSKAANSGATTALASSSVNFSCASKGALRFVPAKIVLLLGSLLFAELILQLASSTSVTVARILAAPWEVDTSIIPDERLLYRGNPLRPDHDGSGYRNQRRPRRAEIVVLGDSHTYGPSNPLEGWPQVLSRQTHRTVYNMALPGYSPAQSLLQLDDALSLQPDHVIEALYFGNDFHDAFLLARRHPELAASVSPALRDEAEAMERARPMYKDTVSLFTPGQEDAEPETYAALGRHWVSQHVKLYGLLRAARYRFAQPEAPPPLLSRQFTKAAEALSPRQRKYASVFDGGNWRTILTAPYRGRPMDERDPRIRLGFAVARDAILSMSERCHTAGVHFWVLLVPTKESVFWPRVSAPESHPGLQQLVADEERLRRKIISDMRVHGIDYLDLLEVLRAVPAQPYYDDADSHPNPTGHRIIATKVAEHLAKRD